MARKALVLDSWALMAFFENEASAKRVEALIIEAHQSDSPLWMSVVNLGELWYSTVRGHTRAEAERVVGELANLRVEIIPADWEITRQAAEFKTRGKIAYADCFAAALAKLRKAELLTGDPEFELLEKEIKIIWLHKG